MSCTVRLGWIERDCELSLVRQCELVGVSRATVYLPRHPNQPNANGLILCALIDEEYTRHPFYGSRRMVVILLQQGFLINCKRVQRLMCLIGLVEMAPGPTTAVRHPVHKVYQYLLRGVAITRPNHVGVQTSHIFAWRVALPAW